ncbi:MAG: N-acetyltransferase family protein [Acidobacteriota bacterium]
MTIRAARDDDFAAITAITNHYIATTAIHFAYEPVTAGSLADTWRAHERHPWLVIEDGGAVTGYAKAGVWRERTAYQWTCEVGLYIAHDARGRGLGRAIYTALLAECQARGFHSAIAGITMPNDASVALHARLGFESVGVVREAGFKHGRWHDVAFFQKRLTSAAPAGPP